MADSSQRDPVVESNTTGDSLVDDSVEKAQSTQCSDWKEYTERLNTFLWTYQWYRFVAAANWQQYQQWLSLSFMRAAAPPDGSAQQDGYRATFLASLIASQIAFGARGGGGQAGEQGQGRQYFQWPGGQGVISVVTQRVYGRSYRVPSMMARVGAEFIDTAILIVIKVFMSALFADYIPMLNTSKLPDILFNEDAELDFDDLSEFMSNLLVIELFHRIATCLYEGIHTAQPYMNGHIGGSTPGKNTLGLRIIAYDKIYKVDGRIVVTNPRNPGIWRAMARAIIKNFSIACFIPTPLTAVFNQYGLAVYDSLTKCVVVCA